VKADELVALRRDVGHGAQVGLAAIRGLGIARQARIGNPHAEAERHAAKRLGNPLGEAELRDGKRRAADEPLVGIYRRAGDAVFIAGVGDLLKHEAQV
jgi:hypothetical protein